MYVFLGAEVDRLLISEKVVAEVDTWRMGYLPLFLEKRMPLQSVLAVLETLPAGLLLLDIYYLLQEEVQALAMVVELVELVVELDMVPVMEVQGHMAAVVVELRLLIPLAMVVMAEHMAAVVADVELALVVSVAKTEEKADQLQLTLCLV